MDAPRTQWVLTSEPFLHWRRPQSQTKCRTCISTPRCQHLPFHPCPLPSLNQLRKFNGWLKATSTRLPLPRRSRQPLRRRRVGLEIRQHRRRSQPRRRDRRHWRRTHLRNYRSSSHAPQTNPEPASPRRQRHRPPDPQTRRRTPSRSLTPGLRRPLHARLSHPFQLPRLRRRGQRPALRPAEPEPCECRGVQRGR